MNSSPLPASSKMLKTNEMEYSSSNVLILSLPQQSIIFKETPKPISEAAWERLKQGKRVPFLIQ